MKLTSIAPLVLGGLLTIVGPIGHASEWPNVGPLADITFGAGRFVAVGGAGNLVWSDDGIVWNKAHATPESDFVAIVYAGSYFVAVDLNGALVQSVDGAVWTDLGSLETEGFPTDLAYGAGTFVICDDSGSIYASRNGTTWTVEFSPAANAWEELYGVAYGSGRFVAVGIHYSADGDSYGLIRGSTTGFAWTRERQKLNEELYGVIYTGSQFAAVGCRFTDEWDTFSQVLTSPTGTSWTQQNSPGGATLAAVTHGAGLLAAAGDSGTVVVHDGSSWAQRKIGSEISTATALAHGAGRFVVVGGKGIVAWSVDGNVWVIPESVPPVDLMTIAGGDDVIVGGNDADGIGGSLWVSQADGGWGNSFYAPDVCILQTCHANGIYLAVGLAVDDDFNVYSLVLHSEDGRSWGVTRSIAREGLCGVAFGGGQFVAVGFKQDGVTEHEMALTSPDGRVWTVRHTGTGPTPVSLNSVCYGTERWVTAGTAGTILTSHDGLSWTRIAASGSEDLSGVAYGPSGFVAAGLKGTVLTSPTGLDWIQRAVGTDRALETVVAADGTYFCLGAGGFVARSSDLIEWTRIDTGLTADLYDGLVRDGLLWVVGKNATMLKLPIVPPQPARLSIETANDPNLSVVLTLNGQAGSLHQLESTEDPSGGAWSLGQLIEIGGTGIATVTFPAAGACRFFRCVVP